MVELGGHLLRPCKSTAAFEAIPKSQGETIHLDLNTVETVLEQLGYEEVTNVKVLIIMKKEIEVTIYPNGKLILKTDSKEIASGMMNEIYGEIL